MFCSHVRYVQYVCMHVCTKSFLKTTTNSLCVCAHLANKADSDSDSDTISGSLCNVFTKIAKQMCLCVFKHVC